MVFLRSSVPCSGLPGSTTCHKSHPRALIQKNTSTTLAKIMYKLGIKMFSLEVKLIEFKNDSS